MKTQFQEQIKQVQKEQEKLNENIREHQTIKELKYKLALHKRQIQRLRNEMVDVKKLLLRNKTEIIFDDVFNVNIALKNIKQLRQACQCLKANLLKVYHESAELRKIQKILINSHSLNRNRNNSNQQYELTASRVVSSTKLIICLISGNLTIIDLGLQVFPQQQFFHSFFSCFSCFPYIIVGIKQVQFKQKTTKYLQVFALKLLNCYDIWKRSDSVALYFKNSSIIKGLNIIMHGSQGNEAKKVVQTQVNLAIQPLPGKLIQERLAKKYSGDQLFTKEPQKQRALPAYIYEKQ